jgi:hypothetical protein
MTSARLTAQARFRRIVLEVGLPLLVMACAFAVLTPASESMPFAGDEGHHIWASRYFAHVFLEHDLQNPEFDASYVGEGHYPWAIDHLMVGRYIIGGWLWSQGYDLYSLPAPYWHNKTLEQNKVEGRVPSDRLLRDARRLLLALSAIIVAMVYTIGRLIVGHLAGLAGVVLLLSRPLIAQELLPVQLESIYIAFALGALLIWIISLRASLKGKYSVLWTVVLGIACGLATATKLTALLSIAAMTGWTALAMMAACFHSRLGSIPNSERRNSDRPFSTDANTVSRPGSLPAVTLGWRYTERLAIVVLVTLCVLVVSDPYLMAEPRWHIVTLFRYPLTAMTEMAPSFPQDVADSMMDSLRFVGGSAVTSIRGLRGETINPWTLALSGVYTVLFLAGMLLLMRTSWQSWRRSCYSCPHAVLTITWLTYFVGIVVSIKLLWPRYVLPTVLLGTVISGVGFDGLGRCLWSRLLVVAGCGTVRVGALQYHARKVGLGASSVLLARTASWIRTARISTAIEAREPAPLPPRPGIEAQAEGNN